MKKPTVAVEKFNFNGDDLDVVPLEGDVGLILKRACEVLGLSDRGQSQRLARARAAGATWATTCIMHAVGKDGKVRSVEVIPRRSLPAWAATVDLGRVRADIRPKVAAFHDEAAEALADRFIGRRGAAPASVGLAEQFAAVIAPILTLLKSQGDRLAALEEMGRNTGIMAPERVNAIKARVALCAKDRGRYGVEKHRAASLRIHNRLKAKVGWLGTFCRLNNMPARYEAEVLRELEIEEHETNGAIGSRRQPVLFDVNAPANGNRQRRPA